MKIYYSLIPLSPSDYITVTSNTEHHSRPHMGGGPPAFNPFTGFFFFFFLLYTTIILLAAAAAAETSSSSLGSTVDDDSSGKNPPLPPPPRSGERESPFKPTVAILIGVFSTLFFVTFIFLLCVKQCKPEEETRRNSHAGGAHLGRKNSGIDRVVIESLPIFRFGSLRGQKEGLECAVCLTQFETVEVLRLLPKCKHAFHVECVDTWLDAHSTCPLCRYRVDPEDILLVGEPKVWPQNNQPISPIPEISEDLQHCTTDIETGLGRADSQEQLDSNSLPRRVSGRHSSVGERGGGFFKIILQRRNSMDGEMTTMLQKKTAPVRMSRDNIVSSTKRKRNETGKEKESGECEGPRKDGLLLTEKEKKHRLEHRIIVSPSQRSNEIHKRWSDVQPSELLYLTSEMILSESCSPSGRSHSGRRQNMQQPLNRSRGENRTGAINERSLSEITGLSRTRREDGGHRREGEREAGVVSRWGSWISQAQRSRSVR